MKKRHYPRLFFILAGIAALYSIFSFVSFFLPASAGSSDNVSGWAWSSTIGWISFNCINQGSCGTSDYGVHVESDGSISATSKYAWSSNIGWVDFNPSGTPPGESSANPVNINFATGAVSGWARAQTCIDGCTGGWDGWIRMSGLNHASPDLTGNGGVTLDPNTCQLMGYAWGGGDAANFVGWIHFRGTDYGVNLDPSACIQPPNKPSNLRTTPDPPNYCLTPPWTINFEWDYSDPNTPSSPQQGYEIEIDDTSDFSSPEFTQLKSPYVNPSDIINVDPAFLNAGTNYWRIRVTNELGLTSPWSNEPPSPELPSFEIPPHLLPDPSFTYEPASVSVDVTVQFTDTTAFDTGSTGQSWLWDFGDGNTSSLQNPTHAYANTGTYNVSLTATDDAGTCTTDPPVIVNAKPALPEYREVAPQ